MNTRNPSTSQRFRWKELVVIALVVWLPFSPGRVLRRLMYRTVFARIGTSAHISPGVEFLRADSIEIGNQAKIEPSVRLRNLSQNSKILIGDGARIDRGVDIKAQGSGRIEIGENTFIGPYTCLAGEFISIGKHCLIASHSGIYAINHNFADPTCTIQKQGVSYEGIEIEDDCWLGSGVRVLDGVTIGQGSVIGAGAVVTKDIPPYSIAVGVPARAIANRKQNQPMNSTKDKEHTHNGSYLPAALNTALTEVEETAELIYAEVEEAAELVHQSPQVFSNGVSTHQVLQNLLYQLLHCIRQVMAVDTVTVLLQTEDGQNVTVQATLGLEEEITEGIQIPVGRGFAGRIMANCQQMIVDDLAKVEVVSPVLRSKGIRSMLGVPLLVNNQTIGVFHIGTLRPRQFTRDDAQLLQLVGSRIASTIDRLEISIPSATRGLEVVQQEFGLTCSDRAVNRILRYSPFHKYLSSFLELALLLQPAVSY